MPACDPFMYRFEDSINLDEEGLIVCEYCPEGEYLTEGDYCNLTPECEELGWERPLVGTIDPDTGLIPCEEPAEEPAEESAEESAEDCIAPEYFYDETCVANEDDDCRAYKCVDDC